MNGIPFDALLEQALGSGRHHAYLLISRSFANEQTPIELVESLLSRLAGLNLLETLQGQSSEMYWQAFARHPDLLRADHERSILRKDDVELFRERSLYPPTFARRRFLLIERAERMNNQSANSLLKTIEEPQADCVFVLTTSRPNALPSTIASRCQKILLPAWEKNKSGREQLEKEDALFLDNHFTGHHLRELPRIHVCSSLSSQQKISISAAKLSELAQWTDQCGRRYPAELLRDILVENTSTALKAGELSGSRAAETFAQINAWTDSDPYNPTNSFWLMRILLTLAI